MRIEAAFETVIVPASNAIEKLVSGGSCLSEIKTMLERRFGNVIDQYQGISLLIQYNKLDMKQ